MAFLWVLTELLKPPVPLSATYATPRTIGLKHHLHILKSVNSS
ncbi:hypothetical protein COXBURSA331_A2051 [Coxiella burnetii RSA 331]|nr:hypothetical protein COXBURSA331_A2051 [Coxiella burnetii RSA 331]EDR36648.1 hypothetical protein COXBURSA334_2070 [Coxiella burnetii Q321]